MTPLILALFIFLAVIIIAVGIEINGILKLQERVEDLEMSRRSMMNDMSIEYSNISTLISQVNRLEKKVSHD